MTQIDAPDDPHGLILKSRDTSVSETASIDLLTVVTPLSALGQAVAAYFTKYPMTCTEQNRNASFQIVSLLAASL